MPQNTAPPPNYSSPVAPYPPPPSALPPVYPVRPAARPEGWSQHPPTTPLARAPSISTVASNSPLAAKQDQFAARAWRGLKLTITGVTPGQPRPDGMLINLPGNAVLRLRADQVALYGDGGLSVPLHDFTPQINRLPQPILGTAEEKAPPPVDAMPLTPETTLMMELHAGTPPAVAVDCNMAARQRQQSETPTASARIGETSIPGAYSCRRTPTPERPLGRTEGGRSPAAQRSRKR